VAIKVCSETHEKWKKQNQSNRKLLKEVFKKINWQCGLEGLLTVRTIQHIHGPNPVKRLLAFL
jgi:hypothetical protein